jgi:hypothetical protein
MLRGDVVDAVIKKKLNIYAIDNIEDGIEILTGMKPGKMKADGSYPKNTFNYLVAQKLEELSEALKGEKDSGDNGGDNNNDKRKKKSTKKGKKPGK